MVSLTDRGVSDPGWVRRHRSEDCNSRSSPSASCAKTLAQFVVAMVGVVGVVCGLGGGGPVEQLDDPLACWAVLAGEDTVVLEELLQLGAQARAKDQPLPIAPGAAAGLAPLVGELDAAEEDGEPVSGDPSAGPAIAPRLAVVQPARRLVRDPPGGRVGRDRVHVEPQLFLDESLAQAEIHALGIELQRLEAVRQRLVVPAGAGELLRPLIAVDHQPGHRVAPPPRPRRAIAQTGPRQHGSGDHVRGLHDGVVPRACPCRLDRHALVGEPGQLSGDAKTRLA